MKVTLVVASGIHQGKVIPLTGSEFLIGRDSQCHLRPASQAISKQHCGILVRDGQVYVKDFDSTNGTTVNDVTIKGAEVQVKDGASLKLGPLDFLVRVEMAAPNPDGTPLPASSLETAAALAAVKAATGSGPKTPVRDATPDPSRAGKPGSQVAPALSGSKETAAIKPPPKPVAPASSPKRSELGPDADHDSIAAMLLDMDDGDVPEGSTVAEMPAVDLQGNPIPPPTEAKSEEKGEKKLISREDMSNAATEALRRIMRRPR
jgi:predicted component of type VI protein secretion system